VRVADRELNADQAALDQTAQERGPERLGLRLADIDAELLVGRPEVDRDLLTFRVGPSAQRRPMTRGALSGLQTKASLCNRGRRRGLVGEVLLSLSMSLRLRPAHPAAGCCRARADARWR
jgi:hypothetical protein